MMAYIEGIVIREDIDTIVLFVGGIGYEIFMAGYHPSVDEKIALELVQIIREDRNELYGFRDKETKRFFKRMIDINGVGPRLAQKILNAGDQKSITQHIVSGDIGFLTSLPGVGKKTAQKIILELQGVLVQDAEAVSENSAMDTDVIEALVGLGYVRKDIEEILPKLEGESTESRIREALKYLSR